MPIDQIAEHSFDFDHGSLAYLQCLERWAVEAPGGLVLELGMGTDHWARNLRSLGLTHRVCSLADLPDNLTSQAVAVTAIGRGMDSNLKSALPQIAQAVRPGGLVLVSGPHPAERQGSDWAQAFMDAARSTGFVRSIVLRLNGTVPPTGPIERLRTAMTGLSPDVAVLTQKPGPIPLMQRFYPIFAAPPGRDRIEALAAYDAHQTERSAQMSRMEAQMASAQAQMANVQAQINNLVEQNTELQAQIVSLRAALARATRRRGLRRLAEKLRTARRNRRAAPPPPPPAPPPPAPLPKASPLKALPLAQFDPVPLSPREERIRAAIEPKVMD